LKKLEITGPNAENPPIRIQSFKDKGTVLNIPGITVYTQPQYHYKRTQNCEHKRYIVEKRYFKYIFSFRFTLKHMYKLVITRVTKAAVLATSTLDVKFSMLANTARVLSPIRAPGIL